jgi:hypothetical protein
MQKQVILIVLLSIVIIIDGDDNLCKSYENNIYQVTSTFPNYSPSYSLLTLLPNGLTYEVDSIANGLNIGELGLNLQYSTHIGFYECLNTSMVHSMNVGYLFKSADIAILPTYDRISRHDYNLYFPDNNNTACIGEVKYIYYQTGSDPYANDTRQVFQMSIGNLTCELFEGRHYIWPTTTTTTVQT